MNSMVVDLKKFVNIKFRDQPPLLPYIKDLVRVQIIDRPSVQDPSG